MKLKSVSMNETIMSYKSLITILLNEIKYTK